MRKCSHLKCTGVRKKENDFIFKATGVLEKVLKNQFIFKGWARLIMHFLVLLALFGYNVDALISCISDMSFSYTENKVFTKKADEVFWGVWHNKLKFCLHLLKLFFF